jgi:hypothetical protein
MSGVQKKGACLDCFSKPRIVRRDQVSISGNPRETSLATQSGGSPSP